MSFTDQNLTPAMKQYMEVKTKHPDCLVFFRMGDFYETFYEDAVVAAKELEITLTSRGVGEKKAPLAGIPYHALEPYLAKLIKKSFKVAIVEQLEDPKLAKGLVKRGVVRIVTPGTVIESAMLDENKNNYLMSLVREKDLVGLTLTDLSTGEFQTAEIPLDKLNNELIKFSPSEILIPLSLKEDKFIDKEQYCVYTYDDRHFWIQKAYNTLKEHFNVLNLEGFGLENKKLAICSSGALISYLQETQKTNLSHISNIQLLNLNQFMVLDSSTIRNLELVKNIIDGSNRGTLINTLDKTVTPMGSRLLRKWLLQPLLSLDKIQQRLDSVEELTSNLLFREELKDLLDEMYDLERLISRVSYGSANAKDLLAIKKSLQVLPKLSKLLQNVKSDLLKLKIKDLSSVVKLIEQSIKEDPKFTLREGDIIKQGYNSELDELRELKTNSKKWLVGFEIKEKGRTQIPSLKVKFNKVFGYFIEITNKYSNSVPSDYIRKQTLVNAERFITEELKHKEDQILSAEEKIKYLEYDLFMKIIEDVKQESLEIQKLGQLISKIDVLLSFAIVASSNNYCKPEINKSFNLNIINGRHPVIEQMISDFVPNNTVLNEESSFLIVTGSNMSGKSSWMRQTAIIVLMAQIGSFVPATQAQIGVVDRIFTRVGAYDDLSMGQSTFMVEMNEAANILNNATENSLIILDEIGRGTSTFDGISLAWAIAEFIISDIKAKTLFATHYHQMNKLSEKYSLVKNYNLAVKETDEGIIFIRKLLEGGTDKSYGIQVAKLAGIPQKVIENSKKIMQKLELEDEISSKMNIKGKYKQENQYSLDSF